MHFRNGGRHLFYLKGDFTVEERERRMKEVVFFDNEVGIYT